jgi:hypothetical protein
MQTVNERLSECWLKVEICGKLLFKLLIIHAKNPGWAPVILVAQEKEIRRVAVPGKHSTQSNRPYLENT